MTDETILDPWRNLPMVEYRGIRVRHEVITLPATQIRVRPKTAPVMEKAECKRTDLHPSTGKQRKAATLRVVR